jgi:hypothetical protein
LSLIVLLLWPVIYCVLKQIQELLLAHLNLLYQLLLWDLGTFILLLIKHSWISGLCFCLFNIFWQNGYLPLL